ALPGVALHLQPGARQVVAGTGEHGPHPVVELVDRDVQSGATEPPATGDAKGVRLRPGEGRGGERLLRVPRQLRVGGHVDVRAARGAVVRPGPHPDTALRIDEDHLAAGPRALADRLAGDDVGVDRAGAGHGPL